MKRIFLVLAIFFSAASYGQVIVDTTALVSRVKRIVSDSLVGNALYLDTANFTGAGTSGNKLKINTAAIRTYLQSLPGWNNSDTVSLRGGFKWLGTSGTITNAAPVASSVTLVGTPTQGQTLSTTYAYSDAESNPESGTVKKYYSYTNTSGAGSALLATAATYTLQSGDVGKFIRSSVTPGSSAGTSPGAEVFSAYSTAVAASGGGGAGVMTIAAATNTGNITESPTGTFTSSSGNNNIRFTQTIASGVDARIYWEVTTTSYNNAFGVDVDNTVESSSSWSAFIYHTSGSSPVVGYGGTSGASSSSNAGTITIGSLLAVRVQSGNIYVEWSVDGGSSWNTLGTIRSRPSGTLYIKGVFEVANNQFKNPTYQAL